MRSGQASARMQHARGAPAVLRRVPLLNSPKVIVLPTDRQPPSEPRWPARFTVDQVHRRACLGARTRRGLGRILPTTRTWHGIIMFCLLGLALPPSSLSTQPDVQFWDSTQSSIQQHVWKDLIVRPTVVGYRFSGDLYLSGIGDAGLLVHAGRQWRCVFSVCGKYEAVGSGATVGAQPATVAVDRGPASGGSVVCDVPAAAWEAPCPGEAAPSQLWVRLQQWGDASGDWIDTPYRAAVGVYRRAAALAASVSAPAPQTAVQQARLWAAVALEGMSVAAAPMALQRLGGAEGWSLQCRWQPAAGAATGSAAGRAEPGTAAQGDAAVAEAAASGERWQPLAAGSLELWRCAGRDGGCSSLHRSEDQAAANPVDGAGDVVALLALLSFVAPAETPLQQLWQQLSGPGPAPAVDCSISLADTPLQGLALPAPTGVKAATGAATIVPPVSGTPGDIFTFVPELCEEQGAFIADSLNNAAADVGAALATPFATASCSAAWDPAAQPPVLPVLRVCGGRLPDRAQPEGLRAAVAAGPAAVVSARRAGATSCVSVAGPSRTCVPSSGPGRPAIAIATVAAFIPSAQPGNGAEYSAAVTLRCTYSYVDEEPCLLLAWCTTCSSPPSAVYTPIDMTPSPPAPAPPTPAAPTGVCPALTYSPAFASRCAKSYPDEEPCALDAWCYPCENLKSPGFSVVDVASQLSNSTAVEEFLNKVREDMAKFFGVPVSQIVLTGIRRPAAPSASPTGGAGSNGGGSSGRRRAAMEAGAAGEALETYGSVELAPHFGGSAGLFGLRASSLVQTSRRRPADEAALHELRARAMLADVVGALARLATGAPYHAGPGVRSHAHLHRRRLQTGSSIIVDTTVVNQFEGWCTVLEDTGDASAAAYACEWGGDSYVGPDCGAYDTLGRVFSVYGYDSSTATVLQRYPGPPAPDQDIADDSLSAGPCRGVYVKQGARPPEEGVVCPPPLTLSPLVQARCNPDYDPTKRPCLLQSFCTTCDSPPASVYSALFVEGEPFNTSTFQNGWTLTLSDAAAVSAPLRVVPAPPSTYAKSRIAVSPQDDCHDATSLLKLYLPLAAPSAACAVISPLSTLLLAMQERGYGQAEAKIKAAFGISAAANISICQTDPIKALYVDLDPAARPYMAAEQQVMAAVVQSTGYLLVNDTDLPTLGRFTWQGLARAVENTSSSNATAPPPANTLGVTDPARREAALNSMSYMQALVAGAVASGNLTTVAAAGLVAQSNMTDGLTQLAQPAANFCMRASLATWPEAPRSPPLCWPPAAPLVAARRAFRRTAPYRLPYQPPPPQAMSYTTTQT
eukprot:XP_001702323.1 predicted protein [Chlamydomonas reinhardtii]